MPSQISIHALLAESDVFTLQNFIDPLKFLSTLSLRRATAKELALAAKNAVFLSTLSLRRATCDGRPQSGWTNISIHALLAESDRSSHALTDAHWYFYPRSPCGERHVACGDWHELRDFYPRSPCGERHNRLTVTCASQNFYPRSPCGERPP